MTYVCHSAQTAAGLAAGLWQSEVGGRVTAELGRVFAVGLPGAAAATGTRRSNSPQGKRRPPIRELMFNRSAVRRQDGSSTIAPVAGRTGRKAPIHSTSSGLDGRSGPTSGRGPAGTCFVGSRQSAVTAALADFMATEEGREGALLTEVVMHMVSIKLNNGVVALMGER